MKVNLNIQILLLALFLTAGCSDKSKPNIELIQDMMESPAIKAQEYDASSPGSISGMRVPPENTAPIGFKPYAYATDLEGALRDLKNPYAGDMSPETLLVGQKYYETQCMVCHGVKGEGAVNSTVAEKMALKPPSMVSEKVRGWPDAHIYHVITMGQGVMGPYASHVPQQYRWQLVNYIRFLQQKSQTK